MVVDCGCEILFQVVKTFMEELHRLQVEIDQNNVPVQWNTAVKFLMARKFDTRRALDLYRSHEVNCLFFLEKILSFIW